MSAHKVDWKTRLVGQLDNVTTFGLLKAMGMISYYSSNYPQYRARDIDDIQLDANNMVYHKFVRNANDKQTLLELVHLLLGRTHPGSDPSVPSTWVPMTDDELRRRVNFGLKRETITPLVRLVKDVYL